MNNKQQSRSREGSRAADLEKGVSGSGSSASGETSGVQTKRGKNPGLKLVLPERITPEPSSSAVHFEEDILDRDQNGASARESEVNHLMKGRCSGESKRLSLLSPDFSWIHENFTRTRLKPVFRCAIAAWMAMLLVIIRPTQRVLGQSSFLILIAAFMAPPSGPFIAVLERELVIQFTVVGSFAWACLGVRVANIARSEYYNDAVWADVVAGKYIEAAPTVISAVFLCLGTSILLYLRARMGQGKPVIPALILSFTAMDSTLTVAALYPYPYYMTGESVVVPIAFHTAISLFCALCIFPESVHGQFRNRFSAVFVPLAKALRGQPVLLNTAPSSSDFNPDEYNKLVFAAESALGPLASTNRLMKKDISWGRFGADDFKFMHELASRMTVRANGMAFYFKIMDPSRHRFPGTSAAGTPVTSPLPSRATSPSSTPGVDDRTPSSSRNNSLRSRRRRSRMHLHHHHYFNFHFTHGHSSSLFHEVLNRPHENPVGVFESQKYLNLETRFTHPGAEAVLHRMMQLLGESANELLLCCAGSIDHFVTWLQRVNDDRIWKRYIKKRCLKWEDDAVVENEELIHKLRTCLDEFRHTKRHRVLELYRPSMALGYNSGEDPPPHRYLFQCYLYQYHLIHFTLNLIELLEEVSRLESDRKHCKLWLPDAPLLRFFSWSRWEPGEDNLDPEDDEDPEVITGTLSDNHDVIGEACRRDPDALPPRGAVNAMGSTIYHTVRALGHGNAVFAFKGGVVAALLSLPSFLPQTSKLALRNRFVWAIVLGQTTLSRFRGDTAFGLFSRIWATFLGGLVGLLLWYISTGTGSGNPYGLAVVTAVCFPFFIFARLYFPAPPIAVIFFFLTSQLVIGYSWQDSHLPSIANAGWGFQVAWKRFVLVTIGVTAAFIFSLFPPTTTLRKYLRITYATTVERIGQLYCDIVSFATVRDRTKTRSIVQNLVAVRMKLNRSRILKRNVSYEFSLRGSWPEERYNNILEVQMEIAYLLSHLRSVEEHLEPEWAKAFLRRTRFLESDFQGDVLAVISMISTALRTGTPLPQITPCPLLDRFVANHHALFAARGEAEPDYNIPRNLTLETLENEQYLCFSVGVATAFGIVTRLDRLMQATKELVGEQYHIHGIVSSSQMKQSEKMLL